MTRAVAPWVTIVLVLALSGSVVAAKSTVVLAIDGMT